MPPKDKMKKEIDPEVLMRKKFRAKCLFRALGRLVMANAYWLIEGVDEYEGVEDVKRRVQQAVRSKAKKKQLLNINDKALLNKHANDRTDQEKKYIYRIIGGLKCFKKYPNHVKKKLAAVTYFKYYGPGRVIVRQHQEAHALYFIVSGDVVVSQMIFDDLLQKFISVDIGTLHTGDMFGEVSLLHNIPRTATCTTIDQQPKLQVNPTSNQSAVYKVQCVSRVVWVTGHCEMLVLMKEDFKNVLQASVQKQWDEVRRAMSSFTYFDALDEVARREGCIVAKMKSYETNETLLGDGQGIQNFVYFILSGRCQMIESLQVIVTSRLGKKNYTLYDPFVPKVESEQDFDTKYFKNYQNLNQSGETRTSTEEASQKRASGSKQETIAGSTTADKIVSETTAGGETVTTDTSCRQRSSTKSQTIMTPSEAGTTYQGGRGSIRVSIVQETAVIDEKHRMKIKTYFMQVCQFNPGSSFGFGEEMRDRRIIALTPVSCMLLPMVWLLQRNTANIWTRIHHYLEKKIPNKKQLFKEFYSQRRWEEYREQLVTDVVERSETVNSTSVHDVPYSIRMEEMLDI